MNEILQEVIIQVLEAPGVPSTGGIASDNGLISGWGLALVIALMAATAVMALTWRKSRISRRIFTPIIALTLIAVPLTASVSAASMTSHDETLTLTVVRPETTANGTVDLSELFAEASVPIIANIQNISDANIEIELDLDKGEETLAVDVVVPAAVAKGDYTAEIVYSYPEDMQSVTSEYCQSLETWDGTTGDVITLTDKRNNQDYNIAKLADGKCWMLNNLKLGSTTGTMALTPDDTNISSNWTLPQVGVSTVDYYDQPVVDGPVPGSSNDINSDNFYGYLYNWCGATAGGTVSGGSNTCTPNGTMPESATGDVCPVNWRLPAGGYYDAVDNEFSMLSAKMGGYPDNTDAGYLSNYWSLYTNWQPDGAWRGTWSGIGNSSSWNSQGLYGGWWSSSHDAGWSGGAHYLLARSNNVIPDNSASRNNRFAVRCLLD